MVLATMAGAAQADAVDLSPVGDCAAACASAGSQSERTRRGQRVRREARTGTTCKAWDVHGTKQAGHRGGGGHRLGQRPRVH